MIGKAPASAQRPTALGIMLQASTYGQTIPRVYGRTKTPVFIIWGNDLRRQSSGKKGKKTGKKKGAPPPPQWAENADFLIGSNPITSVLQMWVNRDALRLQLATYQVTATFGNPSITIPDTSFYAVLGCTITMAYGTNQGGIPAPTTITFNDYGDPDAPQVIASANYEFPLWNDFYSGPDPNRHNADRRWPWTYQWIPGQGRIVTFRWGGAFETLWPAGATVTIYYLRMISIKGTLQSPMAAMHMQFEEQLGNGTEYVNHPGQQIFYPMYAGMGTNRLDLGVGAVPNIKVEVLGAYNYYPSGDCDFTDIVEDIFKMGWTQANPGDITQGKSELQFGLSCFELPGPIQSAISNIFSHLGAFIPPFPNPVKQNNFIVAFQNSQGVLSAASDTLGTTFTQLTSADVTRSMAWGQAPISGFDQVSMAAPGQFFDSVVYEFAGVDTVDYSAMHDDHNPNAQPLVVEYSIPTTNNPGEPAFILVISCHSGGQAGDFRFVNSLLWKDLDPIPQRAQFGINLGGVQYGLGNSWSRYRIVYQPGTYKYAVRIISNLTTFILVFKNSNPPPYPKPYGSILEPNSLNLCREQCRAAGLMGSLTMDSQKKAADWLKELYTAMNAAPVWSGFKLKSIPYSEVSAIGNGAVYNSPTAPGPVADLSDRDFVTSSPEDAPITVERLAQTDVPNLVQIQHPDRKQDYNNVVTSQPETGSIARLGLRKDSPIVLSCIQDVAVARMILGIMVRRANYVRNTYKFNLQARWKLLEAMDLVSLTDPLLGLNKFPVRLTSVKEDKNRVLQCEAEQFVYGLNAPIPLNVTNNAASGNDSGIVPAAVNAPIFMEPPKALTGDLQDELWIIVSDSDPNYAGCIVYLSIDGGTSYQALGTIMGNAVTGINTADWPAHVDPDTTNDLPLDLTESLGVLDTHTVPEEDAFAFPCFIDYNGAAPANTVFPFELFSYAVATQTGTNLYTLKATAGNKLRRAIFGTWDDPATPNTGGDHNVTPAACRFAFLDPGGSGILKEQVLPIWTGKTLKFKFVQFNNFLSGFGDLSTATVYTYVVQGTALGTGGGSAGGGVGGGNSGYSLSPANPLSNPNSTHINMAAVTATFFPSGQTTHYNARVFTIADPGATPQLYYVTIFDPNLTGDTGTGTNLTAFCATTAAGAHWGQAGYINIGTILAIHLGGGTGGGGGSNGSNVVMLAVPATTRGDFSLAHGLGIVPKNVDVKMTNDGLIRFQASPSPPWDATNVYLNASDDGLTALLVMEL